MQVLFKKQFEVTQQRVAENSVHTSMSLLQSMAASLPMFTGECPNNPIPNIYLSKLEILFCYFIYTGK